MTDITEVLWSPAGATIPNIGTKALVDVSDGDTPNIRMPIRMLSIDTPEVTARSVEGAAKVDAKFLELADWIKKGVAPVSKRFADYILPLIETGKAGTLQLQQGEAASEWFKAQIAKRTERENEKPRSMFVRTGDDPFDNYNRLLAYVAPSYGKKERMTMSRRERSTFNLDLVGSGWAAPFILFPNIPGELDLPLFLEVADEAISSGKGQHGDPLSLPAYEYRMCEKLYSITKKIVAGSDVGSSDRYGWRSRYTADIRNRTIYGPEDYMDIPMHYRIWIWPDDIREAIAMLNLVPAKNRVT